MLERIFSRVSRSYRHRSPWWALLRSMRVIILATPRASQLPPIDEPEPGDCCEACGTQRVIIGFCGACLEREDDDRRYERERREP